MGNTQADYPKVLMYYFFSVGAETLEQQYGLGDRVNRYLQNYFWAGDTVNIGLMYSEISKKGNVIYNYLPIKKQQKMDEIENAKKGARDL